MKIKKNIYVLIFSTLTVSFFICTGCIPDKEFLISGKTMGTTFHIKLNTVFFTNISKIEKKIHARLKQINNSMSIFLPFSEISNFNSFYKVNTKFKISQDFMNVIITGNKLYLLTNGAWDATMSPVITLWGFGSKTFQPHIPNPDKIKKALYQTGFKNIKIIDKHHIIKKTKDLNLDFGSIAKGYAVDQISLLLKSLNIKSFLVEIGGEVYAQGTKKNSKPWKVGINLPYKNASFNKVYKAVNLKNKALATSGNYRIFFNIKGKDYSHIIDPETGWPVSNKIISVSVTAPNCMFADGLATAIMVMGCQKGIDLANSMKNIDVLILTVDTNNNLKEYSSKNFFK